MKFLLTLRRILSSLQWLKKTNFAKKLNFSTSVLKLDGWIWSVWRVNLQFEVKCLNLACLSWIRCCLSCINIAIDIYSRNYDFWKRKRARKWRSMCTRKQRQEKREASLVGRDWQVTFSRRIDRSISVNIKSRDLMFNNVHEPVFALTVNS